MKTFSCSCALALLLTATSCHWMKQKSKYAIHGAGEAVGTAGSEYTQGVSGKAGEAKYMDFVFDRRTDITSKSKITLE
ncbi:MAG TPA: hypothetical protein VL547_05500 [Dinghuibacter sp.]|uniref:hypothetical protein n=1 Tax=Dinghuibacter sp. TaxID=2024697 RepID=UPI002C1837FF|nr:hypothetical protein [Dinghuibacter sp.]HTJ11454.1 hypothetical protein [Dinghuibacter sp.]